MGQPRRSAVAGKAHARSPLPESGHRVGLRPRDEEHRAEDRVQKLTDEHTQRIDELLKRKEAEIMEV